MRRRMEKPGRKKQSRRWGKRIMMILGGLVGVTAVFLLVGTVLHGTYFKGQLRAIAPYGQIVEVEHGQMHLHAMGDGEKTIVLLPGMGVGLPSADFAPLMRTLSAEHTVVTVEYLGVGFSSTTDQPRTTENYVEEVREALAKAGFQAPFVLMPHSISSIYSEYYAAKYPQEVEAVISLDGTSTAYYEEMPSFVKYVLPVAKFQQTTGTMSLLAQLTTNKEKLAASGYTEKEIQDMIIYGGFSMNDNLLEQISSTADYVKDTMDLPFPASVPYFKVISRTTHETPNKQLKVTPQEYQHQHLGRIGTHAQYEILEGNHFIYAGNDQRIAKIVDQVLKTAMD